MVVLWQNMNMPAGPVNLLTEYTRHHFNMPLACGRVVIYTPVYTKTMAVMHRRDNRVMAVMHRCDNVTTRPWLSCAGVTM